MAHAKYGPVAVKQLPLALRAHRAVGAYSPWRIWREIIIAAILVRAIRVSTLDCSRNE